MRDLGGIETLDLGGGGGRHGGNGVEGTVVKKEAYYVLAATRTREATVHPDQNPGRARTKYCCGHRHGTMSECPRGGVTRALHDESTVTTADSKADNDLM